MCCECVPIDGATCRQGKARQREAKAGRQCQSRQSKHVQLLHCLHDEEAHCTRCCYCCCCCYCSACAACASAAIILLAHGHTHMCPVMRHPHTHWQCAPMLALPISVGGAANSVLKPHVEAASDCASASASVDALRAFLAKRCNSQIQLQIHLQNMQANGGHLSDSPEIVCS